jgi:hypothetical protein
MAKKKSVPAANQGSAVFSGASKTQDAAKARTVDGFRNLAMKLGIATPGEDGNEANQISFGRYQFNLLTRNRIQLEAAYRGSWIVGRVIDCVAEDMTKAGVIISTNDGADRVQEFKVGMSRLQIWQRIRDTAAWGRLYGGAIGVLQIEGQDLSSPLDPDTIEEGQFKGIAVYDRWQLNPVLSEVIQEGPDIGLPAYYDIVLGSNLNDPGQVPGQGSQTVAPNKQQGSVQPFSNPSSQTNYTGGTAGGPGASDVRVHHTRCFRMGGHKLPFFQAITEMMWDESVIERLWDRLIEFETATSSAAGLIGRANLRTVGIEGFREILSAGGEAKQGLVEMFEYMRMFQNSEGLTLIDKNDVFATTAYTFAGLSDMLGQFGEQLSGASETPLVRLFGQSPAGLGGNGETDIRNYYDSIYSKQEAHLRNPFEVIAKVLWRSLFGEPLPPDFTFQFTPLWQMSAKEKSEITTAVTGAVVSAHQDGLIPTSTAMKELQQAGADTGTFTHITDEEIAEAENDLPPMPEDIEDSTAPADPRKVGGGTGDPGSGPTEPKELITKRGINANDSKWKKFKKWIAGDSKPATKKIRHKTADQKAIETWLKKGM